MNRPAHHSRSYGDYVRLAEAELLIANGWQLLDDLAGDPLGLSHVLLAPPLHREAAA